MGRESVGFRRRAELPGVEIRDVENSARHWRCFATGYEFLVPRTWHGEIRHRRHKELVVPGMAFCVQPEEVFTTLDVLIAGSWSSLTIDPEVFHDHIADHGLTPGAFHLKTFVHMSAALSSRMRTMFRLMTPETALLELHASVVDLLAALIGEVVDGPRRAFAARAVAGSPVREHPHSDPARSMDLEHLATDDHRSRFQVLRRFKHKYGLPPHAYQLRVRIGLAQRALRAGLPPADVAAEQGFVDQSHFSRHFKQLVGVTPLAYARAS